MILASHRWTRFTQLTDLARSVCTIMAEKFNVVFVLGGPGAGKGTQCEHIVKEFGYVHLSAGELLRAERNKENSEVGMLIEHHIKNGSIVPVKITCGLLEKAMEEARAGQGAKNHFLIDGFPRNKDNLDGWNEDMNEKANLQCVLFFDCPDEVCIQRCLNRGKAGSGRTDDNIESLKKRIDTYHNSTRPIIEHYEKQNLVCRIDASKSVDEIFEQVKKRFSSL